MRYVALILTIVWLVSGCQVLDSLVGDDTGRPRVIGSNPQNNATGVSPDAGIEITFNEKMDQARAQSAFSMSPAVNGSYSWDGTTMVFTPQRSLSVGMTYQVRIVKTAEDEVGNDLEEDYTLVFSVGQGGAPTVVSTSPDHNAEGATEGAIIVVTFNRTMDKNRTQDALSVDPTLNGMFRWTSVSVDDDTMIFDPNQDLVAGTTYTVVIGEDAADLYGNPLGVRSSFNFSVGGDTTAPYIVVSSQEISPFPAPNSTVLDRSVNITATFSEAMDTSSVEGAFSLNPAANGVFKWNSPEDTVLTFDPNSDLTNATTYTVTIATGAKDLGGNSLDDGYVFSFTVGEDKVLPLAEVATPNATTGVSSDTDVAVVFSEPMKVGLTQIALTMTPAINGAYIWSKQDTVLSFTPNKDLDYDTTYTLVIDSSATDLAGNGLAEKYVFGFTVESPPASPVAWALNPLASVGVEVGTDIVVGFTQSMNRGLTQGAVSINPLVNGSFSWDADSKILTFDPNSDLQNGTTYTLTIDDSAADVDGVELKQAYVLGFTVGTDSTPPVVSASFPSSNQTGVSKNATVSVTFDDVSLMDEGSSQSAFVISPSINGSFDWANPAPTEHTLTFTPAVPLIAGATYQVTVGTGARDKVGNGLVESYVFYFTVGGDSSAPNVVSTIPPLNATNVDKATGVTITFDEAMDEMASQSAFSISPAVAGNFTWSSAGKTLTFTPLSDLSVGVYEVTVGTGAQDLAGNKMVSDYVLGFTVGNDFVPPQVLSVSLTQADDINVVITDGSTGVPVDIKNIIVAFDDEMDRIPTEEAFSIAPNVDGTFSWATTSDLTFNISPTNLLDEGEFYTLTVSTGAEDDSGNAMENSFVLHFTTLDSTPPIVTSTDPSNGSSAKSPIKIISVTFSEDMKKSSTGALSIIEGGVTQFTMDGTFVWSGMDKLYYDHSAPLATASYTVYVDPSAQDLAGNGLPSSHSFTFTVTN